MLKNLVQARRAPQSKLDEAIANLQRLEIAAKPKSSDFEKANFENKTLPSSNFDTEKVEKVQADLSNEADVLYREQAAISNQIVDTDPSIPCPELTQSAIAKRKGIEQIWTKKKHIERNGLVDDTEDEPIERSLDDIAEISVIKVEMKKLSEKRSKLSKKLENLGASEKMRTKWSTELAKADAEYLELKTKRDLL